MKKEKPVCVEWHDACYNSGYYDYSRKEDFEPPLTKTVGFLVKSDKRSIVVCQDRFHNNDKTVDERHIGIIPKKMVRRITYLRE